MHQQLTGGCMSYSKEELKQMAQVVMFNPSSDKSIQLHHTVANLTGLPVNVVHQEIRRLANG